MRGGVIERVAREYINSNRESEIIKYNLNNQKITKMNFSTLPTKNSKKNSTQNQVMLTPLKGNARRDSVEIIGEDMMTPLAVRRQRISSTPSQAVLTKFKRPIYNKERRALPF